MQVIQKTIDLIKSFERFSFVPYRDPSGNTWVEGGVAIGYGNHYYDDTTGAEVKDNDPEITLERGESIITAAVNVRAERLKKILTRTDLTDYQFGALVSVVYQFGVSADFVKNLVSIINDNPNNSQLEYAWISGDYLNRRQKEYDYYCGKDVDTTSKTVSLTNQVIKDTATSDSMSKKSQFYNTNYCDLVSCSDSSSSSNSSSSGGSPTQPAEEQKEYKDVVLSTQSINFLQRALNEELDWKYEYSVDMVPTIKKGGTYVQDTTYVTGVWFGSIEVQMRFNFFMKHPNWGNMKMGHFACGIKLVNPESDNPQAKIATSFTIAPDEKFHESEATCAEMMNLLKEAINKPVNTCDETAVQFLFGGVGENYDSTLITMMNNKNSDACGTSVVRDRYQQVKKKRLINIIKTDDSNNKTYRFIKVYDGGNKHVYFNIEMSKKVYCKKYGTRYHCPILSNVSIWKNN